MSSETVRVIRQGVLEATMCSSAGAADLQALVTRLRDTTPLIWLDSARYHPLTGRWSLVCWDPWLALSATGSRISLRTRQGITRWQGNPLDALHATLRRYSSHRQRSGEIAMAFGLFGYLSYDMNRWIERLPPRAPTRRGRHSAPTAMVGASAPTRRGRHSAPTAMVGASAPTRRGRHSLEQSLRDFPRAQSRKRSAFLGALPEMVWYGMRQVVLVDHLTERTWAVSLVDPHGPRERNRRESARRLAQTRALLEGPAPLPLTPPSISPELSATSSQVQFESMVARVLDAIRAGDVFQANISQQFTAEWRGSVVPLYLALRQINPSPFACLLSLGASAVVSCSPERLVRVERGMAETRPIAGTRPRGANAQEDATNSFELLMSDKERAEHLMLVDLERNDLGRVCRPGSIGVEEFMTVEAYSHVMHLVSQVQGQLRANVGPLEVLRAMFPGGTITGCPKVRCMEMLQELEPVPRGLYTGSIGRLGFDGAMDMNIAIRTMVVQRQRLSFHVGAGIVADSRPAREYAETLAKGEALVRALQAACRATAFEIDASAR